MRLTTAILAITLCCFSVAACDNDTRDKDNGSTPSDATLVVSPSTLTLTTIGEDTTFSVTNSSSIDATNFTLTAPDGITNVTESDDCPVGSTLTAGSSCTVTLTPAEGASGSGNYVVGASNADNQSVAVTVDILPQATLSSIPASGTTITLSSTTHATQTINIINNSDVVAAQNLATAFTGSVSGVTDSGTCKTAGSLQPSASCTVVLTAATGASSTSGGLQVSATNASALNYSITIDSTPFNPLVISFPDQADLTVLQKSFSFKPMVLTNSGDTSLTLDNLTLPTSGSLTQVSTTNATYYPQGTTPCTFAGQTLAAASSCTLWLQSTSTEIGSQGGDILIDSTADGTSSTSTIHANVKTKLFAAGTSSDQTSGTIQSWTGATDEPWQTLTLGTDQFTTTVNDMLLNGYGQICAVGSDNSTNCYASTSDGPIVTVPAVNLSNVSSNSATSLDSNGNFCVAFFHSNLGPPSENSRYQVYCLDETAGGSYSALGNVFATDTQIQAMSLNGDNNVCASTVDKNTKIASVNCYSASIWNPVGTGLSLTGDLTTSLFLADSLIVGGTYTGSGVTYKLSVLAWNLQSGPFETIAFSSLIIYPTDLTGVTNLAGVGQKSDNAGGSTTFGVYYQAAGAWQSNPLGAGSIFGAGYFTADGNQNIVSNHGLIQDGNIYVGGPFTKYNNGNPISLAYVAKWDGTSWASTGWAGGPVKALAIVPNLSLSIPTATAS